MRPATRWRSRWQPSAASAAFFGASQLTSHAFLDPMVIVPLLGGLATLVVWWSINTAAKRPLLTVRPLLNSSIPVAGIVVALFAAAASVSATALTYGVLVGLYSPLHIGLLYLPEVGGAVVSAVVLGQVIRRRAMHYLPFAGMILLAAGIAVFRIEVPSSQVLTLVGSGLTGLGLGATVAPGAVRRRVSPFPPVTSSAYSRLSSSSGPQQPSWWRRSSSTSPPRPAAASMPEPAIASVGRTRARARRRRDWCRGLRAERRTATDARPRAVPRPDRASVVLAAPAGAGSFERNALRPCSQKALTDMASTQAGAQHQAARSSSPSTVRSSRHSPSVERPGSSPAGRDAVVALRVAAGRRRIRP